MARARRRASGIDYWPGFVDALSTMLLTIIFLLSVFMLAQFFLSREVTGKDQQLSKLNKQIDELTQLLALERVLKSDAQSSLAALTVTLDKSDKEKARLQALLSAGNSDAAGLGNRLAESEKTLSAEKEISARAAAQIDILNQQIAALRRQLAAIEEALNASEARDKDSQARITELGSRLNVALAQKVQELARYRSDFFGRLREILGDRPGIRVVGDRFVFESEVLFDTGQANISDEGKASMNKLAAAVSDLEKEIPPEIPWILRIDGHTDKKPLLDNGLFKSNWELSAARAISVVEYMVIRGVSPQRLVAAGFGEFQPLDNGDSDEALRLNRRIELKLTER